MPNPTEPFNIDKLHAEIGKMWGFHGAHMEIFEMIQSQLAAAQEEIKRLEKAFGDRNRTIANLEHQNQKLREQLECAVLWLDNCPNQSFDTLQMKAALEPNG